MQGAEGHDWDNDGYTFKDASHTKVANQPDRNHDFEGEFNTRITPKHSNPTAAKGCNGNTLQHAKTARTSVTQNAEGESFNLELAPFAARPVRMTRSPYLFRKLFDNPRARSLVRLKVSRTVGIVICKSKCRPSSE